MYNSNELKDLTRAVSEVVNEAPEVKKKKLDKPGEEDAELVSEATEDKKKKLDKPGEEDADIDNDGDTDASDKYLANRRKVIAKAVKADAKKDKEVKEDTAEFHMVKLAVDASHTDEQIREFLSQRDGELFESTIFEVITEFEAFMAEATITEARGEVLKVGDEYYHDEKWRKVTAATNKSVTLDVNGAEVVVQGRVSRRQSLLVRKRADVKL